MDKESGERKRERNSSAVTPMIDQHFITLLLITLYNCICQMKVIRIIFCLSVEELISISF